MISFKSYCRPNLGFTELFSVLIQKTRPGTNRCCLLPSFYWLCCERFWMLLGASSWNNNIMARSMSAETPNGGPPLVCAFSVVSPLFLLRPSLCPSPSLGLRRCDSSGAAGHHGWPGRLRRRLLGNLKTKTSCKDEMWKQKSCKKKLQWRRRRKQQEKEEG